MLTFAQRSKVFQQTASITPAAIKRPHIGQNREMGSLLHAQRAIGNQAVVRSLRADGQGGGGSQFPSRLCCNLDNLSRIPVHAKSAAEIQTKLTSNSPGDSYEQEADRVAERIIHMPEPRIQRYVVPSVGETEATHVHAQFSAVMPKLSDHIQSLRGAGRPLSVATRAYFEPRFGFDFSQVRVHTGEQARAAAEALNAHAFTVGQNVAFGAGMYAPETRQGKRLLGHELTHVVQQSGRHVQPVKPHARAQARAELAMPSEIADTSAVSLSRMVTHGPDAVVMARAKPKRCDFADREPHDFVIMAVNYVLRKYYKITNTQSRAYQQLAQRAYKVEILINGKWYWFEVDWWDPAIKLDVAVQGLTAPYTHWLSGSYRCTNGSVSFP